VAGMTVPGTQRLKGGDELRELTYKANVVRGNRLVCYDGSGIAAAKLAFVLTLLGHDDVAVYDGGWAEWGDRLDLPVERERAGVTIRRQGNPAVAPNDRRRRPGSPPTGRPRDAAP